jgi:Flp pilus assembly protein TadG
MNKYLSERGQMAIFIALIFQVLFVFFAMIVNVGLIVHDKINLQNSVDLAAYYAAERQAEILNAIAHQNYEIRQAWKLLSWRIRVLGDLGYAGHPMQQSGGNDQDVSAFTAGANTNGASNWRPTVCVNHVLWSGGDQNVCSDSKIVIPPIPTTIVVAPFLPWNILIKEKTDELQQKAGNDCRKTGPLNFKMAIRWITAYRTQVARSKEIIRRYAELLSQDAGDFKDVNGNTAKGGALKTLKNNLTRANYKSLESNGFRLLNSLGMTGDYKKWLNEVPIYPTIFFTDLTGGGGTKKCTGSSKPINIKGAGGWPEAMGAPTSDYDIYRFEPSDVHDLHHSVFGVEKNPWMMAYVGVYAETKPRKPYLPFGEPITLKAKAFAKPFGGRIGPWFFKKWPQGSHRSAGNTTDKTDALMPMPMNIDDGNKVSISEQELAVPNYSRFPGDILGLLSRMALSSFRNAIYNKGHLMPGFYGGTPTGIDGLAMAPAQSTGMNGSLPILEYNAPWIREIELAAIAPDLFDVTYYSIERDDFDLYTKKSVDGKIFTEDEMPLDIGSLDKYHVRNIETQIKAKKQYASPNAFWFIKEPKHLLTGWAPSGAFKYDFPTEVFGECNTESSDKAPVPGKCAAGGRVGYSVKIIAEDYLRATDLPLGGEGVKGPILNPPPQDF